MNRAADNVDRDVVAGFGDEWSRFNQSPFTGLERQEAFHTYFRIFPWHLLPQNAKGMDVGCGSGRWAALVAPRVGELHCIDPAAAALEVARRNLSDCTNCRFHFADASSIPLPDASLDFGYSLGVLHHLPDTAAAIRDCVRKLRPGAPFLIYLYYAFDNRPMWFRGLWRISDWARRVISRCAYPVRYAITQILAAFIYWPLARLARLMEKLGMNVDAMPLSYYRSRSFYVLRTDALDRFGTRLEHRFTRKQIGEMLTAAGLRDIIFSDSAPYWCAVGIKTSVPVAGPEELAQNRG